MNFKNRLRSVLYRFLMASMLSIGILLPILGILDLFSSLSISIFICLSVLMIAELCTLHKFSVIGLASVSVLCILISLASGSMTEDLSNIFRAITLHIHGLPVTIELISTETVILLALFVAVICFSVTFPAVGSLPSALLCISVAVLLWLSDRSDLIPCYLPALAAFFTLFLHYRNEGSSILRILPWTVVTVILSWFIIPAGGTFVPEWKEKADDLRQSITDTLFFTDPRNVFSISADGYYPQGINQLGGLVEPSEDPVLQVSSQNKVYLRGSVMNEYTGRNWNNTAGGRRYLWSSARWNELRSSVFDEQLPASGSLSDVFEPFSISIRVLKGSASTLFVPQRITALQPGGSLIPYFNQSSEVFITRDLEPGDTYSVTGLFYLAGNPGLSPLIDACAQINDPGYDAIREMYTSLPSHLEQPLYDIAASVTGDCLTPYAKAFTLQNWLARSCRYTLSVADQPENVDFVTNFVINTKEGYCTYFASALTVLCRMVGLPARYVEGYLVEPDENGQAIITGLNAHAWTEVYFSGFGWVTFDATPKIEGSGKDESNDKSTPSTTPEPTSTPIPPESSTETPTPIPESSPTELPSPSDPVHQGNTETENNDANPIQHRVFPWWLLFIMIPLVFLTRILISAPEVKEKRAHDETSVWLLYVQDLFDILYVTGHIPVSGESPMMFMRRCDKDCVFTETLETLGQCIALISYAHAVPLSTDTELFRTAVKNCRKELEGFSRLHYLLRRAFVPLKNRQFFSA